MNDWSQDPELAKVPPEVPERPRNTQHTGTIDERSALWQQDEIKTIMAEQGLNFDAAVNEFIRRHPQTASEIADVLVATGNG